MTVWSRLLRFVQLACAAALFVGTAGIGREWLPSPAWFAITMAVLFFADIAFRKYRASELDVRRDWRVLLRRHGFAAGVVVLVLLALAVRVPALGADLGTQPLDIDERRFAASVKHFFVTGELEHRTVEHYPGLVFWMFSATSLVTYLLGLMQGTIRDINDMPVHTFVYAARLTNVVAGAATVGVTALLGRRFAGAAAGLLGGLIVAVAPLSVQTTSLSRNDPGQVLFMTAAVYAALAVYQSPRPMWPLLAGSLAGIATGIKYTSVFALIAPVMAAMIRGPWREALVRASLAAAAFVLAIAVTNHFLWADFPNFVLQLSDQIAITGAGHYAASTNPAAAHRDILARFGPGWPLLALAAAHGVYTLAHGKPQAWVFWACPLLYSWFTTQRPSQFPRWVYPLLPFVAVAGAAALNSVLAAVVRVPSRRPFVQRARPAVAALLAAVALSPPLWAGVVDFSRRLTPQTQQRVEAWMRQHASGKTVLLEEGWLDLENSGVQASCSESDENARFAAPGAVGVRLRGGLKPTSRTRRCAR
jgi:4-amino-4-deoxy-L-arabinose transferase-like glycosyltransferase